LGKHVENHYDLQVLLWSKIDRRNKKGQRKDKERTKKGQRKIAGQGIIGHTRM
jgi:hypothetical protein